MGVLTGYRDDQVLLPLPRLVLGDAGVGAGVTSLRGAEHQLGALVTHPALGGHTYPRPLPPHLRLGVAVGAAGLALHAIHYKHP